MWFEILIVVGCCYSILLLSALIINIIVEETFNLLGKIKLWLK